MIVDIVTEPTTREQDPLRRASLASSPCSSTALARGAIHIKRDIAIQAKSSYISVNGSILSKGLRGGIRLVCLVGTTGTGMGFVWSETPGQAWDSFGWYHRVQTRCYREGTLASKARIALNEAGLKVPPQRTNTRRASLSNSPC